MCVCEYACTCACVRAHVFRAAGAGAGAPWCSGACVSCCRCWGWGGGGPSPLITVYPPTKLYFRQSRATPEPQNKYILNGTGTTSEGKKRYLPGMISERYGAVKNTCPWLFPQETRFLSMSPSFQQAKNTTSKEGARNMQTGTTIQSLNQGQCNIWLVKYREFRV